MDDIEVRQLYHTAWEHWGAEMQIDICIEEMAELTQAFLKARRNGVVFNKNVYDELADVSICIDQIVKKVEETGKEDVYLDRVDYKLRRLQERLMTDMTDKFELKDITVGTAGSKSMTYHEDGFYCTDCSNASCSDRTSMKHLYCKGYKPKKKAKV